MDIKAIITTLDNLPLLKQQILILQDDPLISEIIVVANGCLDGTNEWLQEQSLRYIIRENNGAGPGRNSGIDAAGKFDYVLLLDGGIRPVYLGTQRFLEWMEEHQEADVLGVDIPYFETDEKLAWRRWPEPISKGQFYQNRCLSLTAYCLARYRAFDGLRFSEYGPFGEPGWGADDDEMACQWMNAGINVYGVQYCVRPYRRGSGSFGRLYAETGIWPNQFGSVYEQRVVWLQQNWPQYNKGIQWGEPWLTVVVRVGQLEPTIRLIKLAHDLLRRDKLTGSWGSNPYPYSVIAWAPNAEFMQWAEPRRLRQHHGNRTIIDGQIVRRNAENEDLWTGDFRIYEGSDWHDAIRPDAHYYGLVSTEAELVSLVSIYNEVCPHENKNRAPSITCEELTYGPI